MELEINPLAKLDTLYSADSVEWCPQKPAFFVCGTYQLVEGTTGAENDVKTSKNNVRVGSIMLLNFDYSTKFVSEVQKVPRAAVTDMKWCGRVINKKPGLAVTGSSGEITLYCLNETDGKLETITALDVCSPNLSLSLDWSHNTSMGSGSEQKVVVSDSEGNISELILNNEGKAFKIQQKWKAHMFDAWITAYDYWDTCTVYSGGDDCTLKGWDTRSGCHKPVFVNKMHAMGVCSIQSNPHQENVFASGSYDEQVCVWDRRAMKEPLATCDVGGGIWRIKWHPEKANYILAACCHSGFHVLRLDGDESPDKLKIIGSYAGHESLAYGAGWRKQIVPKQCGVDADNSLHEVVATCSFYDHSLHVWELIYKSKNCDVNHL